jgi:hypothetical protein
LLAFDDSFKPNRLASLQARSVNGTGLTFMPEWWAMQLNARS